MKLKIIYRFNEIMRNNRQILDGKIDGWMDGWMIAK